MSRRFARLVFVLLSFVLFFGRPHPSSAASADDAVQVTQAGASWIFSRLPRWRPEGNTEKLDCFSCHLPGAVLLGTSVAASRGYVVDPNGLQQFADRIRGFQRQSGTDAGAVAPLTLPLSPATQFADPSFGVADTTGRAAIGLAPYLALLNDPSAASSPPAANALAGVQQTASAMVGWALAHQVPSGPSGYWPAVSEQIPNQADVPETASLVLLLRYWRDRVDLGDPLLGGAIRRAGKWLSMATPADARAASLRSMALTAAGDPAAASRAVLDLLSLQDTRPGTSNGGWKDVPAGAAGGWATGMAVYALQQYLALLESGAGGLPPAPSAAQIQSAIDLGRAFLLLDFRHDDGTTGHWDSQTTGAMSVAASGFNGNVLDTSGNLEIPLEPTAWAIAALSLRYKPPCSPAVSPQNPAIFAGPSHTLQFLVQRAACLGDVIWSLGPAPGSPAGSATDTGTLDPKTGLYTAPADLKSPITLTVQIAFPGESNAVASTTLLVKPRISIRLVANPSPAAIDLGSAAQFVPAVEGVLPGDDSGVDWSVPGNPNDNGSVSAGLYTAPIHAATPAFVTVVATSRADPTVTGQATVTLKPPVVQIAAQPQLSSDATGLSTHPAYAGDTIPFAATVSSPTDRAVAWEAIGPGGSIDPASGLFTVDPNLHLPKVVTVRAHSDADPTQYAEVRVPVYPQIVLSVTPTATLQDPLRLVKNSVRTFTATVFNAPTKDPGVTWQLVEPGSSPATLFTNLPRSIDFTAPPVAEKTFATIVATSNDDPRVQVRAPIVILPDLGFIRVRDAIGHPGDTVSLTLYAEALGEEFRGGAVSISLPNGSLTPVPGGATLDPRLNAAKFKITQATSGDQTTITATFDSSQTSGPGPLMTVPVAIRPDASPGDVYITSSAEFQSPTGAATTAPAAGNGVLTIMPITTGVSVPDFTARAGDAAFASVSVDRRLTASGGIVGIYAIPDPALPPLVFPTPQTFTAGPSVPQATIFQPLYNGPNDTFVGGEYDFFFNAPAPMTQPGVLISLPFQVPSNVARGMQYQFQPILNFLDRVNSEDSHNGTLTIIDPRIAFDPGPSGVRAGGSVPLSVQTQDVPDSDLVWSIAPDGSGSLDVSGNAAIYHAPASPPPGGTVTVRAYSSRYHDVFDDRIIAILPPLSLAVTTSSATLPVGGAVTLSAAASDAGQTVGWELLPGAGGPIGSLNAQGSTAIYHAPPSLAGTPQTVVVRARLASSPGVSSDTTLTLQSINLALSSPVLTVKEGDTGTVQAIVTGGTTRGVRWNAIDSAPSGIWSASSSGRLQITAPSPLNVPSPLHFLATSLEDPTRTAQLEVRLVPRGSLSVTPPQARILSGNGLDLAATFSVPRDRPSVNWSIDPPIGSLAPDPADPLKIHYTAPDDLPNGADTATVTVTAVAAGDPSVSGAAAITLVRLRVAVAPQGASVTLGTRQPVSATVSGALDPSVTWTLSGPGSVSPDGIYTAPTILSGTPSRAILTATSVEDPRRSAAATVTIPQVSVTPAPGPDTLPVGGAGWFTAAVSNATDTALIWKVEGGDAGGTIDGSGQFTAPQAQPPGGNVRVVATSEADPSQSTAWTVRISDVSVVAAPPEVEVPLGAAAQLNARVVGRSDLPVRWVLLDGVGAVTPGGLYSAPAQGTTPADVHLRASTAGPVRSAGVTVHLPAVAVGVSPASVSLRPGEAAAFAARVDRAADTRVRWEVEEPDGGSIAADGAYTAPPTIGSNPVTVRAVSVADPTKSATASIRLIPAPPPAVVGITVTPMAVTLNLGGSQPFAAAVTGTTDSRVQWKVEGPGSIDGTGLYHAPASGATPLVARVSAISRADGATAGFALIQIRTVSVRVSPAEAHLQPGGTVRLTATVANAPEPGVVWSIAGPAGAGSVTPDGVFTAPADASPGSAVTVTASSASDPGAQATALVFIDAPPSAVAQTPWPMARGDVYRTGRSDAGGPGPDAPHLLWAQPGAESQFSTPAIDDQGRIYVGTRSHNMVSLDSAGTVRWSLSDTLRDPGWMRSSPAVNRDGTLYLVSPKNVLFAVHPDGSAVWNIDLGVPGTPDTGGSPSSPLLAPDGSIYVGIGKEMLAVNADGTMRWRTPLSPGGSEIVSSPAFGKDGRILIGSGDGALYALDPGTGAGAVLFQSLGGIDATPAVDPSTGNVVFGSEDGWIYTVSASGDLIGKAQTAAPVYASAAVDRDGTAFVPSSDGYLYAVRGSRIAWRYQAATPLQDSVAVDGYGRVYAATSGGDLVCLGATGEPLWTVALPGPATSGPIVGGEGRIYLSVKGSGLMAFGDGRAAAAIGDLNGDGAFNLADVTLALEFTVGLKMPSAKQVAAGDVAPKSGIGGRAYGDGRIDLSDVERLLRRVLGLEPNPWP